MTAFTYILGAVSLKVLRAKFGRAGYWGISTFLSLGLYLVGLKILGIAFFSLVVLIGVFSELEEMELHFKLSLFFTLVINSLVAGGAFAIWVYSTGPRWSQVVLTYLEDMTKKVAELNPQAQLQINFFEVMLVLPSVIVIMWIIAIYVAILLESRLVHEGNEGAPANPSSGMRAQLAELRLPDMAIWAFIAGLLAALGGIGHQGIEAVGANVLNVCFVLFFFQGIAIVARLFEKLKLPGYWQMLFMALVIIYLFPFVSLLGLTDYWFDFRGRLAKRPKEQFNRET